MPNTTYITVESSGSHYTLAHNNCRLTANESYIPFDWNPLDLPPYTIRLRYADGITPTFNYGTGVQVSSSPNIWDLTYVNANWEMLLQVNYDWEHQILPDNYLLEVLGANSSGVTNMSVMFAHCFSLVNVAPFDTSQVTDISGIFYGCTSLSAVPFLDCRSVVNANNMFVDCTSLTSVPLLDFSKTTSMAYTFAGCTNITSVPLFNTSRVQDFSNTFARCYSLASVPHLDFSSATSTISTFEQCRSLVTTPAFNLENSRYTMTMFYGCSSLTSVQTYNISDKIAMVSSMYAKCYNVSSGALDLYRRLISLRSWTLLDYYSNCFLDCGRDTVSGRADLAQIPQDWGGTMS